MYYFNSLTRENKTSDYLCILLVIIVVSAIIYFISKLADEIIINNYHNYITIYY